MIKLQRSFTTSSTSTFSTHSLSLRHFFMFQFRMLQSSPNSCLQYTALGVGIGNSIQCQRCFPKVKIGVKPKNYSNIRPSFRSFNGTRSGGGGGGSRCIAASLGDFGFMYPGNGIGRSLISDGGFPKRFSSNVKKATDNKKKGVKALTVHAKDKDASDVAPASNDVVVNGVASRKSSDGVKKKLKKVSPVSTPPSDAASDKKDTKVAAKKKKPSKSKKNSMVAELKKTSNSSEPKADSTVEEVPDNNASTKNQTKKKSGNTTQAEQVKSSLGKFTDKPLYPPTGKTVLVVESVTKAKVIQGYLGDMYEVLPSYGHVRDLAARSGSVRPDDDFSMVWEVPSPAWTHLKSIKVALSGAENLILASDPDREGEAIAWHIVEMLQQQGALHDNISVARVVFHEITEKAIKGALQAPREIDVSLVHAYLARRALDYLIGFNISPLLWRKLPGCQSAGRVQSAALSLICDREMEIDEFKPKEYWTAEAHLKRKEPGSNEDLNFPAHLTHFDSKTLNQFSITSNTEATDVENKINSAEFQVIRLKRNKIRRNPPTPYITSTLQQDAANKLHFAASHTMKLAQKLYEGVELSDGKAVGLITYTRTDGLHISDEAVTNIRALITERYGQEFAAQSAPKYIKKVKNAQEAHEAIRPTDIQKLPSMLVGVLDEESLKLYTLIWSRTVSCQMEPAVFEQIQIDIGNAGESIILRSTSSRVDFAGYRAVFTDIETEAVQDKGNDGSNRDQHFGVLSSLKQGDPLLLVQAELNQHHTQPPPRYSEASLVKKLEELGIGRPSTYASTLKVLKDRNYVIVKSRVLTPEFRGRMVSAFLSHHFSEVTDYSFTADMETELDNVSAGLTEWKGLLRDYWTRFKSYCDRTSNVHIHQVEKMLEKKFGDYLFASLPDQSRVCPSCMEGTLIFKVSRFGSGYFIGCDQHPRCKYIAKTLYGVDEDEDTPEPNTTIEEPKLLGVSSGSNEKVLLKKGPYGFYIQLGEDRKGYIPKRSSASHIKDVDSITLEDALELLKYPLTLGNHPDDGQPVILKLARVGFSVRYRRTIASVPKDMKPSEVTFEKALELLSGKDVRQSGRPKGKSKSKEVEAIESF
ncbi:PREDICTED: uncharacterized protein LOC109344452 [Lupinus angustifolius]|uniref:uncharacterized protein LOC109344452 n=1 Tax=Lupinus angustifolius TaxID=3871 RepID=UPI00092FC558|nr:PREDICTED: uncharacterized protein LOC109344452 [Lupinus angustifolius]